MLSKEQVETFSQDAPEKYKRALNKYTLIEAKLIKNSNHLENLALNQLLKAILLKGHFKNQKAYQAILKQCKIFVDDPRVIEVFLNSKRTKKNYRTVQEFAKGCKINLDMKPM